jgi:Domain of unknown function (DUF4279)
MTRSTEASSRAMVFATLRFSGDRLEPHQISAILAAQPTKAYRKGERYRAGPRAGYLFGHTGVWVLATDSAVDAVELDAHLEYLISLVFGRPDREERLKQLKGLMSREGIKADVSCFWRGDPGTRPPAIPRDVITRFDELPAEIETDFEINEI